MHANRFDTLMRSLPDTRSRRGVLASLLGAALGLHGLGAATAKKRKGKGKKKRTRTSPVLPPGPTCTDRLTNGSETDVDCGGDCPRCALDRTCTSRNDCVTALCKNNTCQPCSGIPVPGGPPTTNCGQDVNGTCFCKATGPGATGTSVCYTGVPTGNPVFSCASCAPGTNCISAGGNPEIFSCRKPCGAP